MGFDLIMFLIVILFLVVIPAIGGWYMAKKYPGMGPGYPPGYCRCKCKDRY